MSTARITISDEAIRVQIHEVAPAADAQEYTIGTGVARLGSRHFTSDPPQPEDLTNAIAEVTDHLDDAMRELPVLAEVDEVVVTGETARAVANVEHGGNADGSAFVLSRDAAEDVFRTLATESVADRRHNPGLPAALVDTVVGGCCVMVGLFRTLHLQTVTIELERTTGQQPAAVGR